MMQYVIAELSTNWLFLILGTILLLMLTFGISEMILYRPSDRAHIQTLCFSPDGQRLYGVGFSSKIEKYDEGWVWAWEASTGKLIWRQKMAGHAYTVELSPQADSLLVVGFRKGLYSRFQGSLRSLETGEVLFPLTEVQNNAPTGTVYFTPDGHRLLGCYKEGIQVWDAHTGERLDFWILPDDREGQPTSLYFSADGTR